MLITFYHTIVGKCVFRERITGAQFIQVLQAGWGSSTNIIRWWTVFEKNGIQIFQFKKQQLGNYAAWIPSELQHKKNSETKKKEGLLSRKLYILRGKQSIKGLYFFLLIWNSSRLKSENQSQRRYIHFRFRMKASKLTCYEPGQGTMKTKSPTQMWKCVYWSFTRQGDAIKC